MADRAAVPADRSEGERLMLTSGESLVIRSSTEDALEVEVTYAPGGSAPPKHLHPVQDERFAVLEGELRTRVGGKESDRVKGESFEVPAGVPHQMWNPGTEPARVLWVTAPRGRTEEWFRAIDGLHREGKVGKGGGPRPLAIAPLLSEYSDTFRLALGPERVVRAAIAVLGAVGRVAAKSRR